jgi:murein DD-endopeptidase MepM/ murein hydrolase activator NlpD
LAASSACGAFGVTENGSGGATDTATEIEMRLSQRASVYAMAPGVVVYIQPSTDPLESGEVEGVWVRYGQDYVIKYVHVLNPVVSKGERIETGAKIGTTPAFTQGGTTLYFWEVEVQRKSGSSVTSLAWNSLLSSASSHQTTFNTLYSHGQCTAAAGTSNWKANSSSGEFDSTSRTQPCAFP